MRSAISERKNVSGGIVGAMSEVHAFDTFHVESRVGLLRYGSMGVVSHPALEPFATLVDEYNVLFRAADLTPHVPAFIDACLTVEGFRCCHISAGLDVTLGEDRLPFTDDIRDHVWHTAQWFTAFVRALDDGPNASVCTFVWDQSSLIMTRVDARIVVYDPGAGAESPFSHPASFPLEAYARQLLTAGHELETLCTTVLAELRRRGMDRERRESLVKNDYDLDSRRFPPDPERILAIVHHEFDRPELAPALASIGRHLTANQPA